MSILLDCITQMGDLKAYKRLNIYKVSLDDDKFGPRSKGDNAYK